MQQFEKMLEEWLVTKAPVQIPDNGRKTLAEAMPWIALAGGVFTLLGALGVLSATLLASAFITASIGLVAGSTIGLLFWPVILLSLALLLAEAVAFFAAFAPLRARQKKGWNILYWVALLNAAYAVLNLVQSMNALSFIASVAGSIIGLYLLFQVRGQFTAAAKSAPAKN